MWRSMDGTRMASLGKQKPVLRDARKKDTLRYMEYRPNVIRLNEIKISARFRGVGDFGVGFSP
jgi:hypothetical protein